MPAKLALKPAGFFVNYQRLHGGDFRVLTIRGPAKARASLNDSRRAS